MENYQGDLADIVRATGGGGGSTAESGLAMGGIGGGGQQLLTNWQQLIMSNPLEQVIDDEFGDPFSNARDPLLNDHLDMAAAATGSCFFDSSINNNIRSSNNLADDNNPVRFDGDGDSAGEVGGVNNSILISPKIGDEEIIRRGGSAAAGGGGDNIFSRMLQISPNKLSSPCDSPAAASVATVPSPSRGGGLKVNSSSKSSFVENGGVQISSPSSTGIKRRKSQAKKVVCIPAPTPANSRPAGGEVVPSDLWAWRKYGQKPIKGSPYPRGYYRCSSSKGCSARKQVERSRTDPNMLVITYTSEHNHPWPTQRNALAGSTRSQPSHKTGSTSSSKTTATATAAQKPAPPQPPTPTANLKEEQQKVNKNNNISSSMVGSDQTTVLVKEEMEMDDVDEFSEGGGFQEESYRPSMLSVDNSNRCSEDFFADLGELETDPLNILLFTTTTTTTQGGGGGGGGYSGEEGRENHNHNNNNNSNDNKEASQQLDPFTFYDWTSTDNNVNNQGNDYFSSIQEDSNKGS